MAKGNDLDTYHQDGLKSNITQISKESGRLYSSNLYQEFGSSERRIQDQAGYRSQYHDTSADIHLRAREYNTNTGRFLQQDTVLGSLKNPTTQNKYIYGSNNPFMYRDDAGRFGWNDIVNGVKKAVKTVAKAVDKYIVQPVVKAAKAAVNFVKDLFTPNSGSGNSGYTNYDTYSTTGAPTIYYDSSGRQIVSNQIEPNISPYTRQEIERIQAERIAKEKAIRQDRIRKMCEGAGKLLDQVLKGSYSKNSSKGGTLLEIILGGVPVLGDIGDVRDAIHGVQTGNLWEVGASALGVIPGVGGALKEGAQSAAKEVAQNGAKETAQQASKNLDTVQEISESIGINLNLANKGSTGRSVANSLNEQLAMKQVVSNLEKGKTILTDKMSDPRWLYTDGWVKKAQNVNGTEIHYLYNTKTGQYDDFKFKE